MVKFGGHVEALRNGDIDSRSELYLVPYNDIKAKVTGSEASFRSAWEEALSSSEKDFREARRTLWRTLFDAIGDTDAARGSHPGFALQAFVEAVDDETARKLLHRMTQVHRAATTNSEGLRKLVKKYDKHHHRYQSEKEEKKEGQMNVLSVELLPTLYTSSLYAGQNMLQDGVNLLRELLGNDDDNDDDLDKEKRSFVYGYNNDMEHDERHDVRVEELEWLERLVCSFRHDAPSILPSLVAHRGFHCVDDRVSRRPLENSLDAYEIAWTKGMELCECDIAITKDDKLVLAHDENFTRLALDAHGPHSAKRVSDLTFRELMGLPLKSGLRPPLLIDVLRSASAVSTRSRLVIEIKPGNESAAAALARLLLRHPDLRASVAVVMSFDAVTMHRLRSALSEVRAVGSRVAASMSRNASQEGEVRRVPSHSGMPRNVSQMTFRRTQQSRTSAVPSSFDHFGVRSRNSMLLGSVGLNLSELHFEDIDEEPNKDTNKESDKEPTLPSHHQSSHRYEDHVNIHQYLPQLLLLTVADPPKIPCEQRVSVADYSPVDGWLRGSDGNLDGVYLQYESAMLTEKGAASLRVLSDRWTVGVWQYAGRDPDDHEMASWLVNQGGCSFVNTDLPSNFRKGVRRQ